MPLFINGLNRVDEDGDTQSLLLVVQTLDNADGLEEILLSDSLETLLALFFNVVEVEEQEEGVEGIQIGPEVELEVDQVVDFVFLRPEELPDIFPLQWLENLVYFFLAEINARLELLLTLLGEGKTTENQHVYSVNVSVELDHVVKEHEGFEEDLFGQSSGRDLADVEHLCEPVEKVESEVQAVLEEVIGLLQIEIPALLKVAFSEELLDFLLSRLELLEGEGFFGLGQEVEIV